MRIVGSGLDGGQIQTRVDGFYLQALQIRLAVVAPASKRPTINGRR